MDRSRLVKLSIIDFINILIQKAFSLTIPLIPLIVIFVHV